MMPCVGISTLMYRCVITDGCEIPVYNKHYENTFDVNTDDS